MAENPFTPSFGTVPLVMAGRDDLLDSMRNAFAREGRDPLLSSLLVGARGTGKTALLARIREEASAAGWVSAGTVALPGLLEDVFEQARMSGGHLVESDSRHRLTSVTVGPLSVGWEAAPDASGNWRTRMTRLLEQLDSYGAGLLVTVDEVNADLDEMIQLAAIYQMFVSEGRRVALVMAGLPYHVHQLVGHKTVSFLRRASLVELGAIPDADVESALRATFESAGKSVDDEAMDLCIEAIGGFPYLLQLVGYRAWAASGDDRNVDARAAERGIVQARKEMEESIFSATYRELSKGDLRYLHAMLPDGCESRTADVANRMGVTSGYAAKYKSRLLAQGVVSEPARGWVAFEIPGFRAYLERRLEEA